LHGIKHNHLKKYSQLTCKILYVYLPFKSSINKTFARFDSVRNIIIIHMDVCHIKALQYNRKEQVLTAQVEVDSKVSFKKNSPGLLIRLSATVTIPHEGYGGLTPKFPMKLPSRPQPAT
jgi:hypothetical protein